MEAKLCQKVSKRFPFSLPSVVGQSGFVGIPQVECAAVVHLCPQNAATRWGHPQLPSSPCEKTAALADKAYSAAGQAASALHAMATLQIHQTKALKGIHTHKGSSEPVQALPLEKVDPALTLLSPVHALHLYMVHTQSFKTPE